MLKKHYSIQLLRFIFCGVIINYHFYSLFLKSHDNLPNFFCRGYIADEFFFMVSGFFVAFAVMQSVKSDSKTGWSIKYVGKRIRKIAIPYYFAWLLCFIAGRITQYMLEGHVNIVSDLLNSIYELTFLEMFGFTKGLYSNSLGWFFSALIIAIIIICPLIRRLKKSYIYYVAPIVALFGSKSNVGVEPINQKLQGSLTGLPCFFPCEVFFSLNSQSFCN